MSYVDGFLLVVPKKNFAAYKKMASQAGKVWMKHGALAYVECVGDDMMPAKGIRPFAAAAKAKGDELVIFSYIVYESKAHRNKVNAKVMKDPMMDDSQYKDVPMPFDMKRLCFAGFKPFVDL